MSQGESDKEGHVNCLCWESWSEGEEGMGRNDQRAECLNHSVQGEPRWGWNKGDCVGCLWIAPLIPTTAVQGTRALFFQRENSARPRKWCPETGAAEGSFSYVSSAIVLLAWCWGWGAGSSLCRDSYSWGLPRDDRVGPGESGLCLNRVEGGVREPPALLLLWAALLLPAAFPLSTSLQFVSPTWAHSVLCLFFCPRSSSFSRGADGLKGRYWAGLL